MVNQTGNVATRIDRIAVRHFHGLNNRIGRTRVLAWCHITDWRTMIEPAARRDFNVRVRFNINTEMRIVPE